ncbi:MAG: TolC family protein [Gemmatimonadetes bacterium]|nr:TolC family protein [Gemmatimonadota bacterium]MCC6772213.1 TolC family protein [Gemmatimonadaceae bacterium]
MKFVHLALLACPMVVWGQDRALTIEQAVSVARARGPLVATAQARRMMAQGRARTDGAFPNPTAEWRRENLQSTLQPDIFATVQLPVDLTGRRLALRSAGTALLARGRADSSIVARQLEADVMRAFWRAALGAELLAVATEERQARENVAEFDARRFREGAVAEVAVIRTRLESDRARITEAAAHVEAARARGDLARLLGMPVDSLPPLTELETVASLPELPDESAAVTRALAQRVDLEALRYAASEAGHRATAERRGVIPDLQLISGYKQTSGVNTGVLGVLVPLPLFSRNEGPRERMQGESVVARAELRDAELRVHGEVVAAMEGVAAMRAALAAGTAGIDGRAAEVAQIAEGAYREGAISLMELVEAQRARAESRAAALRWTVDLHLVTLELNRALGAPLLETR